jgi:hypothetical protein
MTPREACANAWVHARGGATLLIAGVLVVACHTQGTGVPWGAPPPPARAVQHADVLPRSPGYDRLHSHVLVREVTRPTRAALDYAAYHANFMIVEEAPEAAPAPAAPVDVAQPFGGLLEHASFSADIDKTALSPAERSHPLAFAPLTEYLLANETEGAERLEELDRAVRGETWGQPATPGSPSQTIGEVFLHRLAPGRSELWVKIEFAPWLRALGHLPDQDRDGVPELYARARADRLTPAAVRTIEQEYAGRELGPQEITRWANQLSSYWYPSFNTDLLPAGPIWPDEHTEADIKHELAGRSYEAPSVVLRGKPQGRATYNVLLIRGNQPAAGQAATSALAFALPKTKPSPDLQPITRTLQAELARHGDGSWATWAAKLAPFRAAVQRRMAGMPRGVQAVAGHDGFLFYRKSLQALIAGDLEAQPPGKNPLPVIVEYKDKLAGLGVDFLFVAVPSKAELFPGELDPRFRKLTGTIVNPWPRKLLLALCEHGVEVVDLLSPFLADRAATAPPDREPLYQRQDTHWSSRGLELAAATVAARIRSYPWYAALGQHAQPMQTRTTSFTRFGDLHSRLPQASQPRYRPETLAATQVLRADGSPYEDDPRSPIVVLGDSFTGVYELTDAEHAGVSAHIARQIAYPVDLVMSYGGGPNVRNKLMRRGREALASKRLVIWVMAARDLYDYWEDWEPLKNQ